jgi:hypothetical protein
MTEIKLLSHDEFLAGFPSEEYLARRELAERLTIKARDLNTRWGPQGPSSRLLRACDHKTPSHVRFRANRTLNQHRGTAEFDPEPT